jgi:hypothetical protein
MIDRARTETASLGIEHVEFSVLSGDEIGSLPDKFDLVAYGSSLHWMDIHKTLTASFNLLNDDGGVAILWMRSIWGGKSEWEQAVVRMVQRWMGTDRKAGSSTFSSSVSSSVSFEDALVGAGFSVFDNGVVEADYTLDIPFILGHLYSTSYCNRELLGDDVFEFEHDLTHVLLEMSPDGIFDWSPGGGYFLARKRG